MKKARDAKLLIFTPTKTSCVCFNQVTAAPFEGVGTGTMLAGSAGWSDRQRETHLMLGSGLPDGSSPGVVLEVNKPSSF